MTYGEIALKYLTREWDAANIKSRMLGDMIRTHSYIRDVKEYNSIRIPLLKWQGGILYSDGDIVVAIQQLLDWDIHSFVVMEDSSYCLKLLMQLLEAPVRAESPFSLSIGGTYNKTLTTKWEDKEQIGGLLVKITQKQSKGGLQPFLT